MAFPFEKAPLLNPLPTRASRGEEEKTPDSTFSAAPHGTHALATLFPSVKTLGYFQMSQTGHGAFGGLLAMVLMLLFTTTTFSAATNDLSVALQRGLFEEEANHDLPAAMQAYQAVITQFDKDRKLTATAVFRLGECYRKQGKMAEAKSQYERIVREFADQTKLVQLSRNYASPTNAAPASAHDESESDARKQLEQSRTEAEAELARYQSSLTKTKNLSHEELRKVLPHIQIEPDQNLYKWLLELLTAERNIAELKADYSDEHPEVKRAQAAKDIIEKQINEWMDGIVAGWETKAAALKTRVEKLKTELGRTNELASASASPIVATVDEEQEIRRIKALIKNSPDLINAGNIAFTDSMGINRQGTLLHAAAALGQLTVAEFLLNSGADINAKTVTTVEGNTTSLALAAAAGHKAMVELLMAQGANPNAANSDGNTPLHLATEKGYRGVVESLLANKADLQAQNKAGKTPLFLALKNKPLLELFLAKGADANTKSKFGWTPLFQAVTEGQIEAVKLLLQHKADVNAFLTIESDNDNRLTPLHLAVERQHLEIAGLLLQNGADVEWKRSFLVPTSGLPDPSMNQKAFAPLHVAVVKKNKEIAELLLKRGANPNSTNEFGSTSLHWAMFAKDYAMAELLLAYKAEVNAMNVYSNAPLHWAAGHNQPELAELLLKNGADVNAQTSEGETALYISLKHGWRPMIELLLAHKADPNVPNKEGKMPLSLVHTAAGTALRPINPIDANKFPDWKEIGDLLVKYGADENLERRKQISVTRNRTQNHVVFYKGTNDYNRFTLLELFANTYHSDGFRTDSTINYQFLSFPDLAKMKIHRLASNSSKEETLEVNLEAILKSGNCAKDIELRWGDIVEIPETDHRLEASWRGFYKEPMEMLQKCLERTVSITVKGETTNLILRAGITATAKDGTTGADNAPTWKIKTFSYGLMDILSPYLLASSDKTRVQVKRKDGSIFTINLDPQSKDPYDLYLRDGDVIKVPEKP